MAAQVTFFCSFGWIAESNDFNWWRPTIDRSFADPVVSPMFSKDWKSPSCYQTSTLHSVVAVETKRSVLDRLVPVRCGKFVDVWLDPAKFTSASNIKHCVSIVFLERNWTSRCFYFIFVFTNCLSTRQPYFSTVLVLDGISLLYDTPEYELCGHSPESYKKKMRKTSVLAQLSSFVTLFGIAWAVCWIAWRKKRQLLRYVSARLFQI